MAGNAPLIMLGALKEYVGFREPKKVLWLYYEGNDMDDLISEKETFYKIILPLSKPALVITALFSFMTSWSEYVIAAIDLQNPKLLFPG